MADPYADNEDYAARTGQTLSAAQEAQIDLLLAEVSEMIRARAVDVDARLEADPPTLALTVVQGVAIRAVQRYLANPTQAAQLVKGPFSAAYAAVNARGLWLTDDDLAELAPVPLAGITPGIGTIRLGRPMGTVGQVRRGAAIDGRWYG